MKDESAIPSDALEQDVPAPAATTEAPATDATQERQPNPRIAAMEAIEAQRLAAFEEESGVKLDDEPAPAADPASVKDETTAQIEKQMLVDGLSNYQVKMKVNGEERIVSLEDVLRTAQKHESADQRLAEATRLLREAEAARAAPIPAAKTEPTPAPQPTDPAAVVKEAVNALFEGDTEAATAKLTAALAAGHRPAPAPVDTNAIAATVKQQLAVEGALDQFAKDYAEVVRNPRLARMADGFLAEEMQGGVHANFSDALKSAGNRVREDVRAAAAEMGFVPAPVVPKPDPTTTRQEKLDKKATVTTLPTASATAATAVPQPQTTSDVIAEMRKARGQG